MGKIIYAPKGKAQEYAKFAFSAYLGCTGGCHYCYLKKGRGSKILGGSVPTLKKCFHDEEHALEVFEKELKANLPELQKHGLFFSFTTDPMLPETIDLTILAIDVCMSNNVPVKILTKVDFNQMAFPNFIKSHYRKKIAFGFTLTGHDEMEPGASTNTERIEAMRKLHDAGFKTFASIEPIIDFDSSLKMINIGCNFQCCDLFKIGLESGKKYDKVALNKFIKNVLWLSGKGHDLIIHIPIYFKDSLLKQAGINRADLPSNCVTRDYNIFQS